MTQLRRTIAIAAALTTGVASIAVAQRPRSGGGGVGATPGTVAQPPSPSGGSARGTIGSPPRGPSAASPRTGGTPRIVTAPTRRSDPRPTFGGTTRDGGPGRAYGTTGSTYGSGSTYNRRPVSGGIVTSHPGVRYRRQPYSRWGASVGCAYGCFRIGIGRTASFVGSFHIGYPFAIPIYVPYIVETTTYVHREEPTYGAYDRYEEPAISTGAAASKLIVVGGGTGVGDAVTVETIGDSVRLSWLAAGRAAREVRLFVADSAKRELAARTASPSAPVATFEVVTLSAPVAFAGVAVTFTDGVTTTTVVPYQHGQRR